jgi:DNA-binding GntR family transcriptional regulator
MAFHGKLRAMPRAAAAQIDAAAQEQAQERRVHHAIVEAVLAHQLPPGTRLVETPLAEAFGVSRSLLRRVLVRLANDKVIELAHNRGATVAQPSPSEMQQVFEVRRLIEGGVLRALDAHAAAPGIKALRKLVQEEHQAHAAGEWSKWVRLSGEFHLQLARLLGNAELVEILRSLVARTTLMIALYDSPGRNTCSRDEHHAILDALESGKSEHACALMNEHLRAAETQLQRETAPAEVDLHALFGGRRR